MSRPCLSASAFINDNISSFSDICLVVSFASSINILVPIPKLVPPATKPATSSFFSCALFATVTAFCAFSKSSELALVKSSLVFFSAIFAFSNSLVNLSTAADASSEPVFFCSSASFSFFCNSAFSNCAFNFFCANNDFSS